MLTKAFQILIKEFADAKRIFSPDPSSLPHWSHPLMVYEKLIEMGVKDQNVLCAAILHDLVEDTPRDLDFVESEFNWEIRQIVDLCTKKDNFDPEKISDNEEYYFKILKTSPKFTDKARRAAMYIKVADRITNLIGITFTDLDEKKQQYIKEAEEYFLPMAQEINYEKPLLNAISFLREHLDQV